MSRTRPQRLLAVGLSVAAALGCAVALGGPSQAATIGTLSIAPTSGSDTSQVTLTTSGPCTDPSATNLQVTMKGAGFPSGGQTVVSNSPISAYQVNGSGGYVVPLSQTFADYAAQQSPAAVYAGTYQLVLFCRTATGSASLGDFPGSLYFKDAHNYVPEEPVSVRLSANLSSPRPYYTLITFTATVRPAGAAGTVAFKDGGTQLAQVSVSNGTAKYATRGLKAGKHYLTAVFTPSGKPAVTSPTLTYVISPVTLKATTAPSVTGTARVGSRLTCRPGVWSPAATSYLYQWTRNGSAITGAKYSTYVLVKADHTRYVGCTVTARRSGYTNGRAASKVVHVA